MNLHKQKSDVGGCGTCVGGAKRKKTSRKKPKKKTSRKKPKKKSKKKSKKKH